MKKLFSFLLLSSLVLSAGELPGKWSGKFDITNSSGETKADSAYMNLKLDGSDITGTAGPSESRQWAIKGGKLAAGKLTFKVEIDDGGFIDFDLVFDGDTIRGSAAGMGKNGEKMSAKVDLKRVN
jgi:hypothetical protein